MPGPTVSQTGGPPNDPWSGLRDYAGGTNLTYSGQAKSVQQPVTLAVSSISTANPAVVTVTAHGLQSDNLVTISGGSGDWAGINGPQKITVTGANTFTIPINTSAYSSTFAGTITTQAPQSSAPCWAIQKFYYDGSGNNTHDAWAAGGTNANQIWDNRANLTYQ